MARFQVADWAVGALRLTAFLGATDPNKFDFRTSWSAVVGAAPETELTRRPLGQLELASAYEDAALTGRARLVAAANPQRVDWQLVPGVPDLTVAMPDSLGKLPEVLTVVQALGRKWFSSYGLPPIKRLAVGAVLVVAGDTQEDAAKKLVDFLPDVRIDPKNSKDLVYQINRPRQSQSLPGLKLNRLSKWSFVVSQVLQINAGVMTANLGSAPPVPSALLELDLNTDAERTDPIPNGSLPAILDELAALVLEIATSGDTA
jgi:hypothetical protein